MLTFHLDFGEILALGILNGPSTVIFRLADEGADAVNRRLEVVLSEQANALASGAAKLFSPAWPAQAAELGAPAWAVPVVPWVEVVLGSFLLAGVARAVVAWLAVGLIAVFTVLVGVRLAQGRRPPCACFGRFSARSIGPGTLVRNAVLIALAVVAAVA